MRRTARLRILIVVTSVVALIASGCVWNFQTLDGNGGSHGQITNYAGYNNTGLAYNGAPHVFYQDSDKEDLRHGYWNGSFWAFETLDGAGGPNGRTTDNVAGDEIAAVVYNGRPHVFYDGTSRLRHGWYNGSVWVFEDLDGHQNGPHGQLATGLGSDVSAVLYNGRPHVFYYDYGFNDDLRHGYWNGQFWAFETLDGHQNGPHGQVNADLGRDTSVMLYNGRPHVFYQNYGEMDLRHGYYNGQFWAFETLDGYQNGPHGQVDANVGWDSSPIVYNDRPHVFYLDNSDKTLRHGYYNGQFWAFETLDGNGGPNGRITANVGASASATIYSSRPRVFYLDHTHFHLRQAYWTGATWAFETLDGHQDGPNGRLDMILGDYVSVVRVGFALDVYYVGYLGSTETLRQARFG